MIRSLLKTHILAIFAAPICLRVMSTSNKTIKDFGYGFDSNGQLRQIDKNTNQLTDIPFQFNISEKHLENQKNYEDLGDAITEHVYQLLESEEGMVRLPVPNTGAEEMRSFIFATPDALTNPDKLLILIHGSGVVRAGQWARSLIVNDNITTGTQFSYISMAKTLGYGVLITNTNDNQREINGKRFLIPQSSTPEEHADSVWNIYIKKSAAKYVAIVAHSYGGVVAVGLAEKRTDFRKKIKAIAMTDSVHSFRREGISADVETFLRKIGRNWVSSHDPLDAPQTSPEYEIPRVSAGNPKHEMTSHSALTSVFEFLEQKYKEAM